MRHKSLWTTGLFAVAGIGLLVGHRLHPPGDPDLAIVKGSQVDGILWRGFAHLRLGGKLDFVIGRVTVVRGEAAARRP